MSDMRSLMNLINFSNVEEVVEAPIYHQEQPAAYSIIEAMRELRAEGALINEYVAETVSTGQGGGSAGNGGGQMVGGPTTYEQEYDMFKSKGPRRIIAMTEETITLNQLYKNGKPDHNETIWDYGTMIWDNEYEVQTINPRKLEMFICDQYDVEFVEDLFERLSEEQHEIIDKYIKDPNLSNYIIVLDNGFIVDGNHRALAAALTKRPIKYIDISDEEELI